MSINLFNEDIENPEINAESINKWIVSVVNSYDKVLGDLNFIFCSDKYLLKINKEYLQHDFYTDIITFDYCDKEIIAGDIFISLERVSENAEKFNTQDTELYRVIIHGVLHLLGFDDHSDEEKVIMRQKEDVALGMLE